MKTHVYHNRKGQPFFVAASNDGLYRVIDESNEVVVQGQTVNSRRAMDCARKALSRRTTLKRS
jgi:hypothetical protein